MHAVLSVVSLRGNGSASRNSAEKIPNYYSVTYVLPEKQVSGVW